MRGLWTANANNGLSTGKAGDTHTVEGVNDCAGVFVLRRAPGTPDHLFIVGSGDADKSTRTLRVAACDEPVNKTPDEERKYFASRIATINIGVDDMLDVCAAHYTAENQEVVAGAATPASGAPGALVYLMRSSPGNAARSRIQYIKLSDLLNTGRKLVVPTDICYPGLR